MAVDEYSCFAELNAHEARGKDYDLEVRPRRGARVAVIAPHGGRIEPHTSSIAEMISDGAFSLYCFKGIKAQGNARLHITSHHFDEPECLKLTSYHDWVLAIHGCREAGERVLLGGLDKPLIQNLSAALTRAGIKAETSGHGYPGEHPYNICNRGARNVGAQFELSMAFRENKRVPLFVDVVRKVLMRRQGAPESVITSN